MPADEGASGAGPRLQGKGQGGSRGSICLVKNGEQGTGDEVPPPTVRTRPRRPEREALVRAECAVIALRDALRTKDLEERHSWFKFARSWMIESIRRIEADLDRDCPPCPCCGQPWRVIEKRIDRMREARFEREARLDPIA